MPRRPPVTGRQARPRAADQTPIRFVVDDDQVGAQEWRETWQGNARRLLEAHGVEPASSFIEMVAQLDRLLSRLDPAEKKPGPDDRGPATDDHE